MGADTLYGQEGQDRLYGNPGPMSDGSSDTLYGGKSKDTLAGGGGLGVEDSLYGEGGDDKFIECLIEETDFVDGVDRDRCSG